MSKKSSLQNVSQRKVWVGCFYLLFSATFSAGISGQAPAGSSAGQAAAPSTVSIPSVQAAAPQAAKGDSISSASDTVTSVNDTSTSSANSQQTASGTKADGKDAGQGNSGGGTAAVGTASATSAAMQPTDFQRLVERTLGKPIPIYGQGLFANPQVFAALTDTEATADYVVSTGDEVLVHVWGPVQIDSRLTVDRAGNIYVPKVGEIRVSGYRYGDLDAHIREAVGQVFHDVNISVDLGHLRSIQIFVTGMAAHPGTYVVSSLSTLINAIFATGGPSPMGSYRHIQLRRGDAIVSELDLYELIIHGDKSKDVRLQPGDVIYIPPVGPQIAVGGSVKDSAVFELLQGATLGSAIQMAGGPENTAAGSSVKLERIVDHDHREARQLALPSEQDFSLMDGDVIVVGSISPRFEQTVTIRGNILSPGRFAWHPGMKLSEIIPSKDSLLTANYWQARNQEGDPVAFEPATVTNIKGILQTNTASTTAVKLPAPEINWSYALIERTDAGTLRNELIPFDLGKLVLEHDSSEDRALEPGDVVTIFSQMDIHVPVGEQTRFVQLEGEVEHAGFYIIKPDDTIQSVLERAGGVTSRAYLYATQLIRTSEQQRQQQQLDEYIRRLSAESQKSALNIALNSSSAQTNIQGTLSTLQNQFILQLQNERATGRVSLQIPPTARNVSDVPAMLLENGDSISVPSLGSTVNVIRSVYSPSLYQFVPNKRVSYYLSLAGGEDRDSDPKHMFVIRANGSVESRQHDKSRFNDLHIFPGDALVIPAKLYTLSKLKIFLDSLSAYGQIGLVAAVALK